MEFKTDENMPVEAVGLLRSAGYDTQSVFDQSLGGAADVTVAAVCQNEGRVLITLDTDFADIRAYPPAEYAGFIVLRMSRQGKGEVLRMLRRLIGVLRRTPCTHQLWVVEEDRVRVRS